MAVRFTGPTVRPATEHDLSITAAAHARLLPHGLFPRLGPRYMQRWHATFLDSPHGVALVAHNCSAGSQGRPVAGFLVGSTHQARHVDRVVARHRGDLARAGALALARRPLLGVHFVRTRSRTYARRLLGRRRPHRSRAPAAGPGTVSGVRADSQQVAVITAVAVEPDVRGSGIGAQLVAVFLDLARASGAPVAELVTYTGTGGASAFYERLGWVAVREHTTLDGEVVRTFRYDLQASGERRSDVGPDPAPEGGSGRIDMP